MVFLFFLTLFAHTLSFDANQYDHKQVMWQRSNDMGEKEDIYTIHWSLYTKTIKIALEVKTLGWIGFGIAEQSSGTMGGSDVLQGFVNSDGTVEFKDRYVLRQLPGTNWFQAPLTDKCQDWTLISGEETGGKTILEVSRAINTHDSQDRPILLNGNTKIILAYGADDQDVWDTYHTRERRLATFLDFSSAPNNNGEFSTYNPPFLPSFTGLIESFDFFGEFNITTDAGYIKQQEKDVGGYAEIVDDVTTYFNFYKDLSEFLQDGDIHIIAVEDIIRDETREFVHHFNLQGFFLNGTYTATDWRGVYGWAPGVGPMVMDQCGFRASKTTGIDFLMLNIHYDNPEKKEGILDTSGVRIYYTREAPVHDCSVMTMGQFDKVKNEDPWLVPGKTKYVYECLDIGVDKNGEDIDWDGIPEVTVFTELLHMHAVGREMWSEIKRDGGEWITTNSIEFWDFNFQSYQKPLIGEYKLKKGDSLRVTCIFETELGEPTHKYGLASQDEMCVPGYVYYPRVSALDFLCNYESTTGKVTRTVETNVSYVTDFGKPKENACVSVEEIRPPITSSIIIDGTEVPSDFTTSSTTIIDDSEATMSRISSTILYIVAFSISLYWIML